MKRIVIVANKWWEADPLCSVLIHDKARPPIFTSFSFLNYPAQHRSSLSLGMPRPPDPPTKPRMTFMIAGDVVEIWCLEDLLNQSESSSSSLEKARVLPMALGLGALPDLVIAFGTAGSREGVSINGSVVIGRRVFIHDPWNGTGPSPRWHPPEPDTIVDSRLSPFIFRKIRDEARAAAEVRMLVAPINPATPPLIFASDSFVSLGFVNVVNREDFAWADASAVAAFKSARVNGQIGSIETTHGIIRSVSASPFLYVSGITDTEGLFEFHVTPRMYSQRNVAAHNAAIAIAWLLPDLIANLPVNRG